MNIEHAKSYPRIAAKLFMEPWAILPAMHDSMCTQFLAAVGGAGGIEAAADDPVGPRWRNRDTGAEGFWHPQVESAHGVALLEVHGILGRHLDSLEMMCGGYDTALLEQQMENIRDDETIQAVVIDFRSPGGIVMGIESAAESIMEVRAAGKKVYAYTSAECASAAYWLASACDEIHAEYTAIVGSISTILAAVDSSEKWAKEGLRPEIFSTGKFKAMGRPGKPWTEDEREHVREKMATVDADFKGFVKKRRGLSDEEMQGQWWHAKHAPKGLVDSVKFRNLGEFLGAVAGSI